MKEIIIIKTNSGQRIKSLSDREQVEYQIVYDDILADEKLSEEEIYRRDMHLAKQDKDRQKEVKLWDKIQNQDNAKLKTNGDNDWDWINGVNSAEQIKPKFWEVYKCAFYQETVGSEVKVYRPVLVISVKWYKLLFYL